MNIAENPLFILKVTFVFSIFNSTVHVVYLPLLKVFCSLLFQPLRALFMEGTHNTEIPAGHADCLHYQKLASSHEE